ncbi:MULTISPECIES: DUF6305 family protein [unclassified Mesotoga]|uniref:DUF6305 family protein n=1 Tax=unclassified Mesotoga TaxID=1184398 RepID=UPI000CB02D80|nr:MULTISPECIES: DUF6305 family protein [unclassified Mesotoga]PNQ05262.1 hypothetical protein RM69_05960 [Mesotoga sp. SC_NapDC3]HAY98736.1 hypothetical protein [Mesotoga sp.]
MKRLLITALLIVSFALLGFAAEGTEEQLILEEPVAVTSAGQSPGALQFTVVAKMIKLEYTFEKLLSVETVDISQFKTLVLVVGASGKGLGAANIDIEAEIRRVKSLAEAAEESGVKVVICNLEGESRRGPSSDRIVTELAPFADAYFVKSDADLDGFFTSFSEEAGVPLATFEKTIDLKDVLAEYFGK